MNDRLKEIAKEALVEHCISHRRLEEFAQLIVKECAEVAHCNFHVDGLTLGGIMKQHFGVE